MITLASRTFNLDVVPKIARSELELWVLLASRGGAQISRLEPSRARDSLKLDEPNSSSVEFGFGPARLHPNWWLELLGPPFVLFRFLPLLQINFFLFKKFGAFVYKNM
ncbi:hypothetical protein Hanom_Chr04g00319681 [Helianthus anomalus]